MSRPAAASSPPALDLSPLERAAERAGLSGRVARVVSADRRRGTWFTWSERELCISESVVERCRPEDAGALLTDEILRRRRLRGLRGPALMGVILVLGLVAALTRLLELSAWVSVLLALGGLAVTAAVWSAARVRASLAADDDTVALLGDPTALVRGLNLMNEEEVRLAGRRWAARPDLHWRAERLVRLHRLCAAPTSP
ncbi:MAG: hypothetical protein ACT4PU_12035 [Planctomycetota bacterium]